MYIHKATLRVIRRLVGLGGETERFTNRCTNIHKSIHKTIREQIHKQKLALFPGDIVSWSSPEPRAQSAEPRAQSPPRAHHKREREGERV